MVHHVVVGYMLIVKEIVNGPALEAEATHGVSVDIRCGLEVMMDLLADQFPRPLSEWTSIYTEDGLAVDEDRCRMVPKFPKDSEGCQDHRRANHQVDIPAGVVGKSLSRKVKDDNHLAVANLRKLVYAKHKHIGASKAGRHDDKDSFKECCKCRPAEDKDPKKHIASCVTDGNVGDGNDTHGDRKSSKGA